jgi:hypothetical protein
MLASMSIPDLDLRDRPEKAGILEPLTSHADLRKRCGWLVGGQREGSGVLIGDYVPRAGAILL